MHQALAQPIYCLVAIFEVAPAEHSDALGSIGKLSLPFGLVGHHNFGGARGRWCADIGDKIGNSEIDFVPDGADDRQRTRGNRPCNDFFIKRPQVLQRAAATANDEHIALVPSYGRRNRLDNLVCGRYTLYGSGVDHHRH